MKGDGYVFQRGNRWYMQFSRDGKQIQMACGKNCKSETAARTKLKFEIRKTNDEFIAPAHKRITVADLIDSALLHWKAAGKTDYHDVSEGRWKNHMQASFATVKAALFGTAHLDAYRAKRVKEGAATATINRELTVVRQAFILGFKAEPPTVKRVPRFGLPKEDNVRKQFATREQIDALKVAAGKESLAMRVLIEIACLFGWRRGDLLFLRVKDVHLPENTIRLEDSKNGEAREVPMTPALRTLVEGLIVGRSPESHLWPQGETTFMRAYDRVRKAAGCPDLMLHSLRRTSARTNRAAGIDTSVIMQMSGWKTESMFRRYGIVALDDKVAALQKLDAYQNTQKA